MNPGITIASSNLKELPTKLKLDLYVEVVIASLVAEGRLDMNHLYIRPQGTFTRNYEADLAKIEVREDKIDQSVLAYFDITREGLYDMLPEGLFHRNLRKSKNIDTEESVQELKMHQEEEKSARKFFLPLEQMFYQQRIAIEIEEQKSLIGLSEVIVDELITGFWNIPITLSYYQSLCLVYMLPLMHKIVGDLSLTKQCLEILLQVPVELEMIKSQPEEIALENNTLGSFALGDTQVLGDILLSQLDTIQITLGPLEGSKSLEFIPNGSQRNYFELILSYFIPAELEWRLEILANANTMFTLEEGSGDSYLGFTSTI